MKTFTIVIQVPNTEYEDSTLQNDLQILLNQLVSDSIIVSTTHTQD